MGRNAPLVVFFKIYPEGTPSQVQPPGSRFPAFGRERSAACLRGGQGAKPRRLGASVLDVPRALDSPIMGCVHSTCPENVALAA